MSLKINPVQTQLSELVQYTNATLAKFNLPDHKKDCTKPQTVVWLLKNLHVKNKEKLEYPILIDYLCLMAEVKNLVKRTELDRIRTATRSQKFPDIAVLPVKSFGQFHSYQLDALSLLEKSAAQTLEYPSRFSTPTESEINVAATQNS